MTCVKIASKLHDSRKLVSLARNNPQELYKVALRLYRSPNEFNTQLKIDALKLIQNEFPIQPSLEEVCSLKHKVKSLIKLNPLAEKHGILLDCSNISLNEISDSTTRLKAVSIVSRQSQISDTQFIKLFEKDVHSFSGQMIADVLKLFAERVKRHDPISAELFTKFCCDRLKQANVFSGLKSKETISIVNSLANLKYSSDPDFLVLLATDLIPSIKSLEIVSLSETICNLASLKVFEPVNFFALAAEQCQAKLASLPVDRLLKVMKNLSISGIREPSLYKIAGDILRTHQLIFLDAVECLHIWNSANQRINRAITKQLEKELKNCSDIPLLLDVMEIVTRRRVLHSRSVFDIQKVVLSRIISQGIEKVPVKRLPSLLEIALKTETHKAPKKLLTASLQVGPAESQSLSLVGKDTSSPVEIVIRNCNKVNSTIARKVWLVLVAAGRDDMATSFAVKALSGPVGMNDWGKVILAVLKSPDCLGEKLKVRMLRQLEMSLKSKQGDLETLIIILASGPAIWEDFRIEKLLLVTLLKRCKRGFNGQQRNRALIAIAQHLIRQPSQLDECWELVSVLLNHFRVFKQDAGDSILGAAWAIETLRSKLNELNQSEQIARNQKLIDQIDLARTKLSAKIKLEIEAFKIPLSEILDNLTLLESLGVWQKLDAKTQHSIFLKAQPSQKGKVHPTKKFVPIKSNVVPVAKWHRLQGSPVAGTRGHHKNTKPIRSNTRSIPTSDMPAAKSFINMVRNM